MLQANHSSDKLVQPDLGQTHPNYDPYTTNNDVALLRLPKPINYTDYIRPICLPSSDVDLRSFSVCVATGFGYLQYQGWYLVCTSQSGLVAYCIKVSN